MGRLFRVDPDEVAAEVDRHKTFLARHTDRMEQVQSYYAQYMFTMSTRIGTRVMRELTSQFKASMSNEMVTELDYHREVMRRIQPDLDVSKLL